jgi:hypothetical protein
MSAAERAAIENSNYWHDRRVRVRASQHDGWTLDENAQRATVTLPETECDECDELAEHGPCELHQHDTIAIPFKWIVCGICDGRGTHVNPSIDCGGISREDFDDDPDFAESYRSGAYDVTCGECNGRRVVPELTPHTDEERAAVARLEESERADAEYESVCRAERAMGA